MENTCSQTLDTRSNKVYFSKVLKPACTETASYEVILGFTSFQTQKQPCILLAQSGSDFLWATFSAGQLILTVPLQPGQFFSSFHICYIYCGFLEWGCIKQSYFTVLYVCVCVRACVRVWVWRSVYTVEVFIIILYYTIYLLLHREVVSGVYLSNGQYIYITSCIITRQIDLHLLRYFYQRKRDEGGDRQLIG